MAGHIPESFIDELLMRIDIVDIIRGRIELKRAGANFLARCPFHTEKSPSFTVSQTKQFYHCFGCGAHGSALKFLMEYDRLHFVDAVEMLANRVGLTVPRDENETALLEKSKSHASLYEVLEKASDFYQKELISGNYPSKNQQAIEYLKNRGITKQTIVEFKIGYASPAWDGLYKALAKNKSDIEHLLAAGLIITKETKPYFDRFRDRIMFPIRNKRGSVVGFGGRILEPRENSPKYLNSPETKVFSKSHELYGLYEARLNLKKLQTLIVVEGYLDVLSLSQHGFKNVVATLGTSLTEKHLEILFREVPELYICFDGDLAGRGAAHRVLLLSLPQMKEGRRLRFVFLPEKEDPDSFVRKYGNKSFDDYLSKAKTLTDYLFESNSADLDLNHMEGRAEFIRRLRPLIAKIPSQILQHMLYDRLAESTKVSLETIEMSFDSRNTRENNNSSQKIIKKSSFNQKHLGISGKTTNRSLSPKGPIPPAYKAIAFLLANPLLLRYIKTPHGLEQECLEPGCTSLCAMIDILLSEPHLGTEEALSRLMCRMREIGRPEKEISYITGFRDIIASVPLEGWEAEFTGALARLRERVVEQSLERLLAKAKTGPLTFQEKTELKELLNQKES